MLPGQQLYNGVSSYVFGANLSQDWAQHTVRNTPQMQALIKQAGITIMRCMIVQGSPDSLIDQTVQACQAMGTQMLVILHHSDLAWNQHLVGKLGTSCSMYEFGNEPDLANPSISPDQYLGFWNTHIPVLRTLNKNAGGNAVFIGPTLGVFGSFDNYVLPWLAGCKKSGNMPDAVSYHIYPCTGPNWTASTCAARSTSFSGAFAHATNGIVSVLGHPLSICLTEWGIDADAKHAFANDPGFVPGWTKTAIDDIAKSYDMACLWDAGGNAGGGVFDLVSTQNFQPNPNGQYGAMVERIQHYLSGTPAPVPPPAPTPVPTPTPTGIAPLSLSYSNMVSSILPTANKLLITNSDTPPSAQSYTTFGTQTGFIEVFSQGGMAIAAGSISAPSGRGFVLDPSDLNLAGQTIPAGVWSSIIRLNAARTITNPQAGQLMADLYERMWKYNMVDKTYTHIATLWKAQESITPAFTNYPLSISNVPDVSFGENETLYIDAPVNITQNINNNPQQGIRFNRLATTSVGDRFGTVTTPGYQPTAQPTPVPTQPTVTLADTGLTPGTYEAVIDFSGTAPGSIPITLVITS